MQLPSKNSKSAGYGKNERGQNYDNRPYGLAGGVSAKNLYPTVIPSWLTIGYIEELNAVNVNDLKNFFLRWYGPNNATLTIGGDVNTAQVVKLVTKILDRFPGDRSDSGQTGSGEY